MITNHGIHQWKIIPGLPDTGGQNVFVNQFTNQLAQNGFKITIVNRGGFPHPLSGMYRRGYDYKDENQRILYLEDSLPSFVIKEEMDAPEASIIITKAPCILLDHGKWTKPPLEVIDEKCKSCGVCLKLSCPAMEKRLKEQDKFSVAINPVLCTGCELCMQVCPFQAIKKQSPKKGINK